ncbi:MAG: crossover junction endodeoxyribonuclease RuvC [Candidatus Omnitrophica bacterium]|nr:crossover junction endodeoxyribonuclease RuvC [Candidatus Omnitrophota bacterium]
MRILGVDPGTRRTGVGVIEASGSRYKLVHHGVIQTGETLPIAQKLHAIFHELSKIIREYKVDVLALENIFYAKNIRSMVKIGEARACAMLAASEHEIDVIEYLPTTVKQAVSGHGLASKEQVQAMVKTLLQLKVVPPVDEADALAIAICHLHHHQDYQWKNTKKTSTRVLTAQSIGR